MSIFNRQKWQEKVGAVTDTVGENFDALATGFDLKRLGPEGLKAVVTKIDSSTAVFRRYGYRVTGVDIQVLPPRVTVECEIAEISKASEATEGEQMAEDVEDNTIEGMVVGRVMRMLARVPGIIPGGLDNLTFSGVAVEIGAIPTLHLKFDGMREVKSQEEENQPQLQKIC